MSRMNQAERNLLAFLQECVAPQAEYEYKLHPQDARIVMVRAVTDTPLAPRGRHQDWRRYEIFGSVESAAMALHALREAQAREAVTQ